MNCPRCKREDAGKRTHLPESATGGAALLDETRQYLEK